MGRQYWLDVFTGKTWEEFLTHGANISGFRESGRKTADKIQPGDYFLCYVMGISRFIGVLEVKSECFFDDKTRIWEDELFPVRFKVELVHRLDPKTGVPVAELRDQLSIFKDLKGKHWSGFFRRSPRKLTDADGKVLVEALRNAEDKPIEQEYDEHKYWRRPKTYVSRKLGTVTVPEEERQLASAEPQADETTHQEIQWLLLKLGADLGLDVWVAKNDRNKEFQGNSFRSIPSLIKELPRQFDEATSRTIELIDVLWLQGEAIVAAFEVEHTSAIYSGLLRMSDLVSMQPNIKIDLYMVAPDDRRDKVLTEISRPTFARLKPPLTKICRFIPYSVLKSKVEQIEPMVRYMKPEFIAEIAESCETAE